MIMSYNMNFNNPIFWSFVVIMCSIALLTEVTQLVHVFFMTRQPLRWYLLLLIPVAVSIWSCTVAWNVAGEYDNLHIVPHIHISTSLWHAFIAKFSSHRGASLKKTGVSFAQHVVRKDGRFATRIATTTRKIVRKFSPFANANGARLKTDRSYRDGRKAWSERRIDISA